MSDNSKIDPTEFSEEELSQVTGGDLASLANQIASYGTSLIQNIASYHQSIADGFKANTRA